MQDLIETEIIEAEIILPLTEEERLEYVTRTKRVLDNYQNIALYSLEVWKDLKYIKDNALYREEYTTFAMYCRHALAKDNSTVYRLLKDLEFKEQLLLEASTDEERLSIMSLKEGNTRFLRTMPEEARAAFWKIAFGLGTTVLPKKEDGSIEPTTAFLESVGENIDELITQGGIHLDGKFIELEGVHAAAKATGTDEDTVKMALLAMGVTENYFEQLQRQRERIKEKSMKADIVTLKGTVESKFDVNGSEYAVIVDSKGNETDINDIVLSFRNRFINLSLKSPLKDI